MIVFGNLKQQLGKNLVIAHHYFMIEKKRVVCMGRGLIAAKFSRYQLLRVQGLHGITITRAIEVPIDSHRQNVTTIYSMISLN